MIRFLTFLTIVAVFAFLIYNRDKVVEVVEPYVPDVLPEKRDIAEIRPRVTAKLTEQFADRGLTFGANTFIRIFKEERVLELWVDDGAEFKLFRSYPICNYSGHLGPKLKEGDRQSPEGIYRVKLGSLNPNSSYHLSFNLGFPNAFDRANDRTGSYLMVHGDCVSIGCYAMTDPMIEEIYVMVEAALKNGQSHVPVHAFPFRMTQERMQREVGHEWFSFWQGLEPIYQAFDTDKRPPRVGLQGVSYILE